MSLKQRTPTAIFLILLVLTIVQWAPRLVFFLFLQLIIFASLLEYFGLVRKRHLRPHPWLGLGIAFLISLSFLWPQTFSLALALVISLFLLALYFLIYTNSIEKVVLFPTAAAITFFGPLFISLPLNFFYRLRLEHGPTVIYFLFAVIFLGDTGAYLIGQKWGRHLLAPIASPRKTVEGAIAGLVWAMAGAWGLRTLLWSSLPVEAALVLGLLVHAAAQVADPMESLFKRAAGVKDSSSILPGHGGVLDRVDSFLLATPVYYYLLNLFLR